MNRYESNILIGSGDWIIAEADESDGTFCELPTSCAIISSISPEHLNYYGSYENMLMAFSRFIDNVPFYGRAAVCIDDPAIVQIIERKPKHNIVTYAVKNDNADIMASNIKHIDECHSEFYLSIKKANIYSRIVLCGKGIHGILNALAVIAIALHANITINQITQALGQLKGVERRMTARHKKNSHISIIDDYAHHPREIKETTDALRKHNNNGKILLVIQPHRFSRLNSLFAEFSSLVDINEYIILLDVDGGGEEQKQQKDSYDLYQQMISLRKNNKNKLYYIATPNNIEEYANKIYNTLHDILHHNDTVLFVVAGNITDISKIFADKYC